MNTLKIAILVGSLSSFGAFADEPSVLQPEKKETPAATEPATVPTESVADEVPAESVAEGEKPADKKPEVVEVETEFSKTRKLQRKGMEETLKAFNENANIGAEAPAVISDIISLHDLFGEVTKTAEAVLRVAEVVEAKALQARVAHLDKRNRYRAGLLKGVAEAPAPVEITSFDQHVKNAAEQLEAALKDTKTAVEKLGKEELKPSTERLTAHTTKASELVASAKGRNALEVAPDRTGLKTRKQRQEEESQRTATSAGQ